MPQITLDMSIEEIKALIFQLPPQELLALADAIEERAETIAVMQMAETGFREWEEEGEDIYDAEA
jgi:signal transduction histidine kinase